MTAIKREKYKKTHPDAQNYTARQVPVVAQKDPIDKILDELDSQRKRFNF